MRTFWPADGRDSPAYLAAGDRESALWCANFIDTYLQRDLPQLGPRIPAETLRRFWTMLAHAQGSLLNAAEFARSLGVDGKTVARYIDLLVDLLLVRRLQPHYANIRKRLVKSPKVYVRDSGLVHALLRLRSTEDVLGHPVAGSELSRRRQQKRLHVVRVYELEAGIRIGRGECGRAFYLFEC